ncbi:DUF6895 family protein [Microbispora sp. H10885]|uniref:DUF6895 family protein n=1 Tax=Microbispora sp. H10885 TaxID=2729110 RepID=UPI00160410FF|nr:hypothetical protein [Microbispora sp. H10885]
MTEPATTYADERATGDLERLSAGARRWISDNLEYLDPSYSGLPVTPKVKACLELAQLCAIWTRLRPDDEDLAKVAATVRKIWHDPDFPRQLTAMPRYYRAYGLAFGALAPPGLTDGRHWAVLGELAPGGFFPLYGRSPHVRLETRYYAERAGLRHDFPSYRELYESTLLADWTTTYPVDIEDAYVITHILFHLSDFGARDPGFTDDERRRIFQVLDELTTHFVEIDYWDLVGEFLLSQSLVGEDPTRTRSGLAAIRNLLEAQLPSGAIPGRYAAQRPPESASAVEVFRKAYHTTLVTAMATMITLSASRRR